MSYAFADAQAFNNDLCQYEGSRLLFRGPVQPAQRPYVAVLGATESCGKHVERPYSDLVQGHLGLNVFNLSCMNAGPDVFLHEEPLLKIAGGAEVAVVQVMGAQNITNPYYSVHPRRNDRFLRASPLLRATFPTVDFTEFAFTRHMLMVLKAASREQFATMAAELRRAWMARMRLLLARLPRRRVLLWLADGPPPAVSLNLSRDPLLVDAEMIAALRPAFSDYVEVIAAPQGGQAPWPQTARRGSDLPLVRSALGQDFHREVSSRLTEVLHRMI